MIVSVYAHQVYTTSNALSKIMTGLVAMIIRGSNFTSSVSYRVFALEHVAVGQFSVRRYSVVGCLLWSRQKMLMYRAINQSQSIS